MSRTERFTLTPRGAFSLGAALGFLEGFTPAAYVGPKQAGVLRLAFPVEGSWRPAAVAVREEDGEVVVHAAGDAEPERLRAQVERLLSLDVDASGFPAVAKRDAGVARLQWRYPGLRPVLFASPYEAAVWGLLSQRVNMAQAASLKRRMAEELGTPVELEGETRMAFPGPARLREVREVRSVPEQKLSRLRSLADAALAGELDGAKLRGMAPEAALEHLRGLAGVGPFTAELILIRGAGAPDVLPTAEKRLERAFAEMYGPEASLPAVAESWRPYRSWVCLLLRTWLEDEAGEGASKGRAGKKPPAGRRSMAP